MFFTYWKDFALIFGAKESTGIVLPMFCFADLLAVAYYRRAAVLGFSVRAYFWSFQRVFQGAVYPCAVGGTTEYALGLEPGFHSVTGVKL